MMTVLFVAGYVAIAALCVYLEARFSCDSDPSSWILWPVFVPSYLLGKAFDAIAKVGEKHRG